MAFQQPIARPSRRAATPPPIQTAAPTRKEPERLQGSQEWILFSPNPFRAAHSKSEAPHTPHTAARSRLSDFGSLDTAAESGKQARDDYDENDGEETEDLDSLDDGLHAFCDRTSDEAKGAFASSADPVLPTHDGLGTFPGDSSPVQQQFWHHEQRNPRRRRHSLRRSSLQKKSDAQNESEQQHGSVQDERFERIEAWRLDQSRAIMDEIEKQSRRQRRRSRLSVTSAAVEQTSARDATAQTSPQHDEQTPETTHDADPEPEAESFWTRLTRRVIRDLMGIDEATLSYIFGEALPSQTAGVDSGSPSTNTLKSKSQSTTLDSQLVIKEQSWEERLFARIARELGVLVHQISEHPGAFTAFLKTQEQSEYAGLPTPSTFSSNEAFQRRTSHHRPSHKHRRRHSAAMTDPSLFGIEEEVEDDNEVKPQDAQWESARLQRERAYWERDLDVKMVFGYLRDRLSSSPRSSPSIPAQALFTPKFSPSTKAVSTAPPQDSLRRAALIRHHHPLVSKSIARSQTIASSILPLSPVLGRRPNNLVDADGASSCASQSTKKSKTRHSGSLSLGSSRNYWDIGGPTYGEV